MFHNSIALWYIFCKTNGTYFIYVHLNSQLENTYVLIFYILWGLK